MSQETPDRPTVIRSGIAMGLVLLAGWTWQVYQFGYHQRAIDSQFGAQEAHPREVEPPTKQHFHTIIRSLQRVADRLEEELEACRRELEDHEC